MQYIYIHIFPRYGLTTGNETMVRQGRHPQARILQKLILVVSKLKSSFLDVGICSRTYFCCERAEIDKQIVQRLMRGEAVHLMGSI